MVAKQILRRIELIFWNFQRSKEWYPWNFMTIVSLIFMKNKFMWESRLTMPTPPECLQVHYILFLSKNYGRPVVYLIYWCYYNCCKSVFESGCFRWLLFKKWTWPHLYSIWKIFVWIATKTNRMDQWTESFFAFISQQARLRFIKNNNWGTFLWCGKHPSLDLQICWDGTWLIYEIHFYAPLMRICIDRKTCLIFWKNWVAKCINVFGICKFD